MSTQGITYDLALRLKNAGFPQDEKGELYLYEDVLTNYCPHGIGVPLLCSHDEKAWKKKKQKPIPVKNPTLSELISACGYGLYSLHRSDLTPADKPYLWTAESMGLPAVRVNGDTPEEAVASLWLALNKK